MQANASSWQIVATHCFLKDPYSDIPPVVLAWGCARKWLTDEDQDTHTVVLEVAHFVKQEKSGFGILKHFNNVRFALKAQLKSHAQDLMLVPTARRNPVGPLPVLAALEDNVLTESCIFSAFYVTKYLRTVMGPRALLDDYSDLTVASLALLWVVLLELVQNQPKCSPTRYSTAKSILHRALSAEQKTNLGKLVHGVHEAEIDAQVPEPTSDGDRSTSGANSDAEDDSSHSNAESSGGSPEEGEQVSAQRPPITSYGERQAIQVSRTGQA